jgi:hypothetical protein
MIDPIEMIDHDAGVFIDRNGIEHHVVLYLDPVYPLDACDSPSGIKRDKAAEWLTRCMTL